MDPKSADVWAVGIMLLDVLGAPRVIQENWALASNLLHAMPKTDDIGSADAETRKADHDASVKLLEQQNLGEQFSADIINLESQVLCPQRSRLDISQLRTLFKDLPEYKQAASIPDAKKWQGIQAD